MELISMSAAKGYEWHGVAKVPVSRNRRLLLMYLLPQPTKTEKQIRTWHIGDSKPTVWDYTPQGQNLCIL